MAVESRFVVIRQGVEVETFMDKKAADEYDKMLDMADNLSEMLTKVPVELSDADKEELSVYLAKHREEVLIALQAKKPKVAKKPVTKKEKMPATKEDESQVQDSSNAA
ncbi:YebG family protein [Thalassotalea sediminis]|uniref:YebG family protein n=1 Tax=Thalassotalea sediminis TaxID=1759089 RepID=UPI0025746D6F|nr:YebG family protein [Thalassotalea sediminis]